MVAEPRHRISIAREQYKFSCAHMTVFPDGTKERLHGHNYTVALALDLARIDLDAMVPFTQIKAALAALCARYKEHVLVPGKSRFLVIDRDDTQLDLTLCGARYSFPREDVLLLPLDNISVEALAAHVAAELLAALALPAHVAALEITVEESPGQGATCSLRLP